MLNFIYDGMVYPEEDYENGVEGLAVVSFIVEREGRITSISTSRSVSPTIDAEALDLVNYMAWQLPFWSPGFQDGVPVRLEFNLPIKFRISDYDRRRN